MAAVQLARGRGLGARPEPVTEQPSYEDHVVLVEALSHLPAHQREILWLRYSADVGDRRSPAGSAAHRSPCARPRAAASRLSARHWQPELLPALTT